MSQTEKIISFTLRIPESLNKQVEESASADKRTKNLQIEWILESYIIQQNQTSEKTESAQVTINT